VSERTLNSALEVLQFHDIMRVEKALDSTFLKTFWPNFEEVFGNHKRMVLQFYSAEAPTINISSGISQINGSAVMDFMNPYNTDYQTVSLNISLEANVEFALLENFVLAGSISDIKLTVMDMRAYFLTDVTVSDIQTKVQSLAEPLE
jgi:hypothetical protein